MSNTKFIELYVEFENKDLVKNLGCKWNRDLATWVYPMNNTMTNLKALMKLQDTILLYFVEERLERNKVKIYRNEDVIKLKELYDAENNLITIDDENPMVKTVRRYFKEINNDQFID